MLEPWMPVVISLLGTIVPVVVFAARVQAVTAASALAIDKLSDKLERHTAASAARVAELERMISNAERMIAQLAPRQRDMDRLEREIESLWKRLDHTREQVARLNAHEHGEHHERDRDHGSDPRIPRTRESNE